MATFSSTAPVWAAHLPAQVDPRTLDLLAGESPVALAVARWRGDPEHPVLRDTDGAWLTGGRLEASSAGIARRLGAAALPPGSRVLLCAETSAALLIAHLGVLRAGLVAVPVNPGYTRHEVERLVTAARPAAALVERDEHATWVARARDGVIVTDLGAGSLPPDSSPPPDRFARARPALLLYTSGTTGRPKGALLTHGNLLASARAVALAWRWTEADRLLLALPMFHMHGLGVGINGSLLSGGQIVLRPRFEAADVIDHCARGDISLFFGVPAMYQRLLATGRAASLASLRLIVSGSAPLSPAQSDALAQATGQRPLERYGMTETVMLTSNLIDGPRKPGRVGLPLPGVDLRLAADGEVQVRGPAVLSAYDRPDGSSETDRDGFTADGWFCTGDLGELDEQGHLRLAGRSKELIITGGLNVHPREVEEILIEFPGVRDAAVVGRPSQEWGEAITALVVADGPVDARELRAFAARRLAAYKVPKAVEFVGGLPRNALGKLLRHEL